MDKDPFKEYIKQSEPNKREKGYAWHMASGLQAVDGLKPSKYLIDTAIKNIEGDISIDEVQELLNSYYEENSKKDLKDRTDIESAKADIESAKAETEQYTNLLDEWLYPIDVKIQKLDAFDLLSKRITWLCKRCDKKIVLMIDEVDKSSNNQVFLHFLGMLRNKYIKRVGNDIPTFWSVILAGVYDIKNMKLKLRLDEEKKYNSPWNIAVDFNVDLSFQAREIATMLQEYENDHHTGMDISSMSEEIFKYTNGYPYLVSAICKFIEESLDAVWTKDGVIAATKHIINNKSPLIDSIIKNYENNAELQMLIERIVIQGEQFPYTMTSPPIDLGITFGLFRENNGTVQISNKIFEIVLYNHIIVKNLLKSNLDTQIKSKFAEN